MTIQSSNNYDKDGKEKEKTRFQRLRMDSRNIIHSLIFFYTYFMYNFNDIIIL